jgi:peptidoglycan pentaglycine glycine transferase (the first glycine)
MNQGSFEPALLIIREITSEEANLWNDLVQKSPDSCFMQSWAWANFKELERYQTFRYGLFLKTEESNFTLVGGCIFYFYPHSSSANLLTAPGGPILPKESPEMGMQMLIEKAEEIAQKVGAIALRIEPLWTHPPDYLKEFVRAPADILPSETLLIDLQLSEAEMLAAMKPKGRYNLRLSWRYKIETEFTTNPQAIPIFYNLFWETVKRQQFFGEPYSFFINLCQTLFAANMAEIGLAKWQGKVLAAIIVIYWGKDCPSSRATYLYGGRSFTHPQVMAPYALHWAAMQRAKTRGCSVYDFYGFANNLDHEYTKFSRFKSQFGGTVMATIGARDYFFYDRLADTLINLLKNLSGDK